MANPSSNPGVTLSVRVSPTIRNQLENLADATGRTKSYIASEAIRYYLETQAWQVQAVRKAVKKANSKSAKFANHETVTEWLHSWGSKKELEPPKCK